MDIEKNPFSFSPVTNQTETEEENPFTFSPAVKQTETEEENPFTFSPVVKQTETKEEIEAVDVGTGLPEQFTEEEETTDISFSDDPFGYLRQNILDPNLESREVMNAAQAKAGAITLDSALNIAKGAVEIPTLIGELTLPETVQKSISDSDVAKTYTEMLDTIDNTLKLSDDEKIASEIVSMITLAGLGRKVFKEGGKYLLKRYGKKKASKIVDRVNARQRLTGGQTISPVRASKMGDLNAARILKDNQRAIKIMGGTGAVAGFTAGDVAVREPNEQILADMIGAVPEAAKAWRTLQGSPEDLESLGGFETAVLKTMTAIDDNIPDWAREAFKKLEIDPNDSAATKSVKQWTDSFTFTGVAAAGLAIPLLVLKLGAKGATKAVSSTAEKVIQRNRAIEDGGTVPPASSTDSVPIQSTLEVAANGQLRQRNVIVERLARFNTTAGRLFSSRAALPQKLYQAAIERSNASKDFNLRIKKEIVDLQQSVKKNKDQDEALSIYVNTGRNTGNLSEDTVTKVDSIKKLISSNESEINNLLGLKGKHKIGFNHGKDGFYLTRFYEASNNPTYLKNIRKALDGSNSVDTNFIGKVENARNYFRNKGIPENNIDGVIESMVLRLSKEDRGLLDNIFEGHGQKADQALRVLKERQKLDEPILDLLGEETNPFKKLSTTLKQQNKLISELNFFTEVDKFAQESLGKVVQLPGLFPVLPSVRSTFKQGQGRGITEGLSELAEKGLGKFGTNRTKILRNMYTSPLMGKYINNGLNVMNSKGGAGIGDYLRKATSLAQATETVLDAPAYLLNLYGGAHQLLANGHAFNPRNYAVAVKELREMGRRLKNKDSATIDKMARLRREGVIEQDPTGELISRNANLYGGEGRRGLGGMYERGMGKFGQLYGKPDEWTKLIAFESELASLKKVYAKEYKGAGANYRRELDDKLFSEAARIVRDTNPTYQLASPVARVIAQTPVVGNYVLFPTELVRTTKNTALYGLRDINKGVRTKNPRLISRGFNRLVGLAVASTGPSLIVMNNNEEMGVTESNRKSIDMLAPDFGKGANNYYMEGFVLDETREGLTEEQKKVYKPYLRTRYLASTSADTLDYLKKPLRLMLGTMLGSGSISEETLESGFYEAGKSIVGQFVTPKFLASGVLNAITGVNPRTGKPIWDEAVGATKADKILTSAKEVLKAYSGGTIKLTLGYLESLSSEELLGEANAQRGNGFNLNRQDLNHLIRSGTRPVTVNLDRAIGFNLSNDLKAIAKTQENFKKYVRGLDMKQMDRPQLDKIIDEYRKLQDRKYIGIQKFTEKVNVFKDIDYIRRFKEKGKIKEEDKKLGIEGVLKAATSNFHYQADDELLQPLVIDITNSAIKSQEQGVFMPDINIDEQLITEMRERGISDDDLSYLIKESIKVINEYSSKPIITGKETEQQ